MRRRLAVAMAVGLLLASCIAVAAAPIQVEGNKVVSDHARFTILSPTLVRLEYAPTGQFVDEPSVLVLNRDWPACEFNVAQAEGWVRVKTSALELRWRADASGFSEDTLAITWTAGGKTGTWHPGQPDQANLGGTRGALDGIGRGNLPPLDAGLLSREGWTLLDDSERPLWLGEEGWLRERPDYAARDWYFFAYGNDYPHMLSEYVTLCGRIPMLPRYAWGAWYSRYWAFTDEEERAIVRRFRELGIPLDVLVIDVDWHQYGWEGYDWNEQLFPDPERFLQWVHDQGVHVTLNNHPGSPLPVEDSHHRAAVELAGLGDEALNQPLAWDLADRNLNRAFVEAVHWPLERIGIDFWWIDGNPPSHMRGLDHAMWCAKTYYDGTQRRTGQRSLVFSRYGGLGQHRYPTGFSGDVHSEWDVLNYEIRFTARAGNVAFPYWSHDIGGFLGDRLDPELYVRWCQFGALSPVLRLHSNHGVREPWEYGEEAQTIVGDYFRLRQRLYPYLNTCQREVYDTGTPLCRPLYMHWPELEEAYHYDYEYMLGPNLLVAPVATPTRQGVSEKELWIPPGLWWDYWTGEPVRGPRMVVYQAPLDRCPLFAKAGAIIPMQPTMDFMGQKPMDPLTLDIWAGADAQFSLYEDDGLSLAYQADGFARTAISTTQEQDRLLVSLAPRAGDFPGSPAQRGYLVQVHGVTPPSEVVVNGETLPGRWREAPVELLEARGLTPAAERTLESMWGYDADNRRVLVYVPVTEVSRPLAIELIGVRTEAFTLQARLRATKACAEAAVAVARDVGLEPEPLGRVRAVAATADAALAAIGPGAAFTDTVFTRVSSALEDAWKAVAGSSAPEPARRDVLQALVGLTANARLWTIEGSRDLELRVVVGTRVPLPDAALDARPILQDEWPLLSETRSAATEPEAAGSGVFSYRIAAPTALARPPLGLLELGADVTVTFAGQPLTVPVRTGLDCSFVQQWHLVGPFSNADSRGLEIVYPPEEKLDFTRTYPGLGGEARWQTTTWSLPGADDPAVFINLEPRFQPKDHAVAYAVAYIISDRDQDALFSIGTDDGCKVWLNGEQILYHPQPRAPSPGQDRVNVRLKQGQNVVLYKVANEMGQWGLYLQVLSRDGKPAPGLHTTLGP